MEPLNDPNDILDAFVQRRNRELQPEQEPTGNDFVDDVIGFADKVGSDIWNSLRTGEIADGIVLGLGEASYRGLNLLFQQIDGPAGLVGRFATDVIADAAKAEATKLETGTAQIAAEASPYVVFGTAAALGGASLAASFGGGAVAQILMGLGGASVSDFAVGATMEDPAEENLANLIVQVAGLKPDHELLQSMSPVFEFLALEEGDSDATARLKRGATEALTNVAGELGFVALRASKAGISASLDVLKRSVGSGAPEDLSEGLVSMGRRAAALDQEILAQDAVDIAKYHNPIPQGPLAVEKQVSRGAERLGRSLQTWEDSVAAIAPVRLRRATAEEFGMPPRRGEMVFGIDNAAGINQGFVALDKVEGGVARVTEIVADAGKNKLGPGNVRSLLRQLVAENPEIESIAGLRVSGARGIGDEPVGEVRVDLPGLK